MSINILVTGGCGALGKAVLDSLSGMHGNLSVIDLQVPQGDTDLEFHKIDITQENALRSFQGREFDTIIHLAGLVNEAESFSKVLDFHQANVSATLRVLEFARRNNVKHLVMVSSTAVCEDDQTFLRTPRSPFIANKMAAERFAEVHSGLHGFAVSVLRIGSLYGEGCQGAFQEFLNVNRNGSQAVLPKNECTFHPVHLADVAARIRSMVEQGGNGFNVEELGPESGISDEAVLAELAGKDSQLDAKRSEEVVCFSDRAPSKQIGSFSPTFETQRL